MVYVQTGVWSLMSQSRHQQSISYGFLKSKAFQPKYTTTRDGHVPIRPCIAGWHFFSLFKNIVMTSAALHVWWWWGYVTLLDLIVLLAKRWDPVTAHPVCTSCLRHCSLFITCGYVFQSTEILNFTCIHVAVGFFKHVNILFLSWLMLAECNIMKLLAEGHLQLGEQCCFNITSQGPCKSVFHKAHKNLHRVLH